MKKSNKTILGLVMILAIAIGVYIVTLQNKSKDVQSSASTRTQQTTANAKSAIRKQFEGYKGEEYDRNFLTSMIVHHQGAIDMAKLALTNAKHDELKTLANSIITAQSSEISEMTTWQSSWGYPASSGEAMTDHSAMGMQSDMTTMTSQLKDKMGDDFDKAFLTLMTQHHHSAIDTAQPAATNASHQQVKDLAKAIISAQTGEISQMKQWQTSWGYIDASKQSTNDSMSGMSM